jgi:hypothetical protein
MNLYQDHISSLDLSKFKYSHDAELKYTISEYEYHLRQLHASLKDVNHHLDKCNECLYLIVERSKNLNK